MRTLIWNGQVYDSASRTFRPGAVLVTDDRITEVLWEEDLSFCGGAVDEMVDAQGGYVMPGLVDVHTHGRNGFDFATADKEAIALMARCYAESGVTTVIPTLASATPQEWQAAIARLNEYHGEGANLAGVHLEGRYLNPAKRGVHAPELLTVPDAAELESLLGQVRGVRHVTFAPELDEDGSFLKKALELGATVGIGHTAATYDQTVQALQNGATVMTHLYNAMPTLHHREGGAVAAGLLCDTAFCELICDGLHVSPEMVKLAYRLKQDKLILITDSMEATGCPDGQYAIAGVSVTVKDGRAQTADGVLAGSTLSLWQGVVNLTEFADLPLGDALYCATYAPALAYGLADEVGSLEKGKRADILIAVGQDLRVMCAGVWM